MTKYAKYHGLGNDYLVVEPAVSGAVPDAGEVRLICHRHYGVGSDGVLIAGSRGEAGDFSLRIFNPDGSEAEKSGNGLRIFARYLWDRKLVGEEPFEIRTKGGTVRACVHRGGGAVTVDMGRVDFRSEAIPVRGPAREVINEEIGVLDRTFRFCAATIGNPHCVIPVEGITREEVLRYGPVIERDARFPNRTNVQFMRVTGPGSIAIEIWERGAGYTLASGSSSCAAAAVARRLGLCGPDIAVAMPGGTLGIRVGEDWRLTMTGPVVKVCEGSLSPEMFLARGEVS